MATVGIWKICSSLRQVIDYTTNELKTDFTNYKNLEHSLEYVKNDLKTEKKLFVDGINCNPSNALKEMIGVKRRFMKMDKILGWHAYHSFKENEVTPKLAHEIGVKVAQEMWGDRFQVVVSTHLNSKCIHNHFVINSVSFIDGKKYYANRTTYAELRRISNAICSEYGLSTLKEKKTKSGINYLNYQNKSLNYTNYYKRAKVDLDKAISEAINYSEFLLIMKNMGYEVINRYGKLSIKGEGYKRNIRIERYFGEDYSIENINKQIRNEYIAQSTASYKRKENYIDLKAIFKPKYNNFYGLYLNYCKLLNRYANVAKKFYIPKSIRDDVEKLEEFNKQTILLATNKIETEEQFYDFMNKKEEELKVLKNRKEDLWKKYKKEINKEGILNEIEKINNRIELLKKDVKLCEKIRIRKDNVKENINSLQEKELINYEHIR